MTKPRLAKVRALFYVLQQLTKRGCAYFDTASTYISAPFGRGCGIIYVVRSGEGDGEVGAGGVLAVDDGDEIVDDVGV